MASRCRTRIPVSTQSFFIAFMAPKAFCGNAHGRPPAARDRLQIELQPLLPSRIRILRTGSLCRPAPHRGRATAVELVSGPAGRMVRARRRRAGGQRRRQRGHHPPAFHFGGIDHALRQVGPAAAQGAFRLGIVGRRAQDFYRVTGGAQHGLSSLGHFRRVVMAEGIDEKHDLAARGGVVRDGADKGLLSRQRNRASGRNAEPALGEAGQPGPGIAPTDEQRQRPGWRCSHCGRPPNSRARRGTPSSSLRWARYSVLISVMSTELGHSFLQPLHETHRSSAAARSG